MSEEKKDLSIVNFDFNKEQNLTKEDLTKFILEVEELAKKSTEQIDVPIEHHFSDAVYAREMRLPAGALIIGKIHKKENLNILSQGEVSVMSIDGVKRVKAPFTFVGSIGAKRVIFAHSDVVWTTIHGTSERDLEKIEENFIAKTIDEVLEFRKEEQIKLGESKCLG